MSVNSLLKPLNTSNPNVWTHLYADSITANNISGSVQASNVSYNDTLTPHLGTNVQSALDSVKGYLSVPATIHGTYTPIVTNVQQAGGGSSAISHYFGSGTTVGSEIVVHAKIQFTATGVNPWVNISLPVPSNIPAFGQVVGLGTMFRNVNPPALTDTALVWGVQSDGVQTGAIVKATVPINPDVYNGEITFMYTIS